MAKVTIGLVNWNTRELLREALESLIESSRGISHEIIVVDNASTDGSAEMVKAHFPQVKMIENSENLAFTTGCNQIMSEMNGDYLLLSNTDVKVVGPAVRVLMDFMSTAEGAAACGPKLLNADLSLQYSARRFHTIYTILFEQMGLSRHYPRSKVFGKYLMSYWNHNEKRAVEYVSGAFVLMRREAIQQVGEFDEQYYFYAQEADWCKRAGKKGWKIYYVPEAQVIHYGGISTARVKAGMFANLHLDRYIFFRKHNGLVAASVLVLLMLSVGCLKALAFSLLSFTTLGQAGRTMEKARTWRAFVASYLKGVVGKAGIHPEC